MQFAFCFKSVTGLLCEISYVVFNFLRFCYFCFCVKLLLPSWPGIPRRKDFKLYSGKIKVKKYQLNPSHTAPHPLGHLYRTTKIKECKSEDSLSDLLVPDSEETSPSFKWVCAAISWSSLASFLVLKKGYVSYHGCWNSVTVKSKSRPSSQLVFPLPFVDDFSYFQHLPGELQVPHLVLLLVTVLKHINTDLKSDT